MSNLQTHGSKMDGASQLTRNIDPFNLGVAAELYAASVLIDLGYDVLLPFDRRGKYDLAGYCDGKLNKFQVKRANWISPPHTTSQYLRVQTQSKGIPYTEEDIDYFLFVCPERRMWMVPVNEVNSYRILTLDKRTANERNWSTRNRFQSEHYLVT